MHYKCYYAVLLSLMITEAQAQDKKAVRKPESLPTLTAIQPQLDQERFAVECLFQNSIKQLHKEKKNNRFVSAEDHERRVNEQRLELYKYKAQVLKELQDEQEQIVASPNVFASFRTEWYPLLALDNPRSSIHTVFKHITVQELLNECRNNYRLTCSQFAFVQWHRFVRKIETYPGQTTNVRLAALAGTGLIDGMTASRLKQSYEARHDLVPDEYGFEPRYDIDRHAYVIDPDFSIPAPDRFYEVLVDIDRAHPGFLDNCGDYLDECDAIIILPALREAHQKRINDLLAQKEFDLEQKRKEARENEWERKFREEGERWLRLYGLN